MYFNLCSLSQAEEQQLLQSEQRRRGCQQSRREGSPYACYPAERRKSRKRKASPAGTPHHKNRFWLARAKAVLLHELQHYWYGAKGEKQNQEKTLKYIYIDTHTYLCVHIYKKVNMLTCTVNHTVIKSHSVKITLDFINARKIHSFLSITPLEVDLAYRLNSVYRTGLFLIQ